MNGTGQGAEAVRFIKLCLDRIPSYVCFIQDFFRYKLALLFTTMSLTWMVWLRTALAGEKIYINYLLKSETLESTEEGNWWVNSGLILWNTGRFPTFTSNLYSLTIIYRLLSSIQYFIYCLKSFKVNLANFIPRMLAHHLL